VADDEIDVGEAHRLIGRDRGVRTAPDDDDIGVDFLDNPRNHLRGRDHTRFGGDADKVRLVAANDVTGFLPDVVPGVVEGCLIGVEGAKGALMRPLFLEPLAIIENFPHCRWQRRDLWP
jgi:hypothetical protein